MSAADRWCDQLRAWAIPEAILAGAPESPYVFPTELFRERGRRSASAPATPTILRAREALRDRGAVLDVGVGGGSTSLPLAGRAGVVVGVDTSASILAVFEETARDLGVRAETVQGAWPDVAAETPACDVVVCGHVLYNVQDVVPFVRALDAHARTRVVVELTGEHPWAWMNDLWVRFHGLERPAGPTAEDAREVLRQLGLDPGWVERIEERHASGFKRREHAVALIRRRLCLPAEADADIEAALGDRVERRGGLWSAGPPSTRLVTMWWDV